MPRFALALAPGLMLAGCGNPLSAEPKPAAQAARPAVAPVSRPATRPGKDVALGERTPLLDFGYTWPAIADAIPTLRRRLAEDARTSRQHALNEAREDRATRPADAPFHNHELTKHWTVAGEAQGLLSLRATDGNYTGGAHGMRWFEAILWDRAAGRDIAVMSLFADPVAARTGLTAAFCPALNAERSKRRGAPVAAGTAWDTACPDVTKQRLVPGDARDGAFRTILVLIAPYEAGPYAEGPYEIALPVTPALVRLLKPARAGTLAP